MENLQKRAKRQKKLECTRTTSLVDIEMKNFKKIIKENLRDFLDFKKGECSSVEGVTACDLLDNNASELINMGSLLKRIKAGDRKFSPKDAQYMTRLIAAAKRDFGENEDLKSLEAAVKEIFNMTGDINPAPGATIQEGAMSDLRRAFSKFELSQVMLSYISLDALLMILFILFLAVSACVWYDQE